MLRVLQVCNVGQIVGGTAACAWTVTKSLPSFEHVVVFLRPMTCETREAFSHCQVDEWDRVGISRVQALHPDVVVLHNIARDRVDQPLPTVSVQYLHSKITAASADLTLYCSHWLAKRYNADPSLAGWPQPKRPLAVPDSIRVKRASVSMEDSNSVLWQAVPKPVAPDHSWETRTLRDEPVIGRICTPQRKKWPSAGIEFYAGLAKQFPKVRWEFIGCPEALQASLRVACAGRANFYSASWSARSRLWHWDAMLYNNPSVTESFGRTVAESMRAGCIPIVDDLGGFSEQVKRPCGFLCRQQEDFADAVAQINSPARRLQMSRACIAHADYTFSLNRFGQEWRRRFVEAAQRAQRKQRTWPACLATQNQ